jgi:hypothetical protein
LSGVSGLETDCVDIRIPIDFTPLQ